MDYSLVAQKLRDIQAMARRIDQQAAVGHMALINQQDQRVIASLSKMGADAEDLLNAVNELSQEN